MTWVDLLEALKSFTEEKTKDLIMPCRVQGKDESPTFRAPDVWLMRLPDSKQAYKKVPYVLHQIVSTTDEQPQRGQDDSYCVVRSIFAVFSDDEQEGALMLLNLAERIRIGLLRKCTIGPNNEFVLDKTEKIEMLIYPDDSAPYYTGEMVTTWHMPPVRREVPEIW